MASQKLKSYKVGCYETVQAYVYVDAKNEKDALEKVNTLIDEQGMPSDAKVFGREFDSCSAELDK